MAGWCQDRFGLKTNIQSGVVLPSGAYLNKSGFNAGGRVSERVP